MDRELLREKLQQKLFDWTDKDRAQASRIAGWILEMFDRYLAEYEPLQKKEPKFTVHDVGQSFYVMRQEGANGSVQAYFRHYCPDAEAEARSLAERLNKQAESAQ